MILTKTKWTLSFDGACEPKNPEGIATYGYIYSAKGVQQDTGNGVIGAGLGMTNNVAEYQGLIHGLKAVIQILNPGDFLRIRSDSQLVIRQLTGVYQVKSNSCIA